MKPRAGGSPGYAIVQDGIGINVVYEENVRDDHWPPLQTGTKPVKKREHVVGLWKSIRAEWVRVRAEVAARDAARATKQAGRTADATGD